jgi:broad specificity phosphatase PhoE
MRKLRFLLPLFCFLSSVIFASDFQKNNELVKALEKNQVRLIVLCNFQSTNNVLNIVTANLSSDHELTCEGRAALMGSIPALSEQNISHIYAAPAFSVQQMAAILKQELHLAECQLSVEPRLAMQNFGMAEGENYNLYKKRFGSFQNMLEKTPPDGESGLSVFKRTEDFLWSLASLQNQSVLLITHSFNYCHISKCLTGQYGKLPLKGMFVIYDFNAASSGGNEN